MDNPAMEALSTKFTQQLHDELNHRLESPEHINRVIGESMRHIGAFLDMTSSSYLPIRPDEMLVIPALIRPDSTDAVVLMNRNVSIDDSFMVMATIKTMDDRRTFDMVAYKPNNFNLMKSQFLQLPHEVGNEIMRQLNEIVKGDGAVLFQAVIIKNYFPVTPKMPEEEPFSSEVSSAVEPEMSTQVTGGLPPVRDDSLL
jgi:hypothetical protein